MLASSTSQLNRINKQIDRIYPSIGLKVDFREYQSAIKNANSAMAGRTDINAIMYPSGFGGKIGVNLNTGKVFSGNPLLRHMRQSSQGYLLEFERAIKESMAAGGGHSGQEGHGKQASRHDGHDGIVSTCATTAWEERTPIEAAGSSLPPPATTFYALAPPGTEEFWLVTRHERQG
ncbi:hypothetical protein ABDF71_25060 [Ochrobactrum sp. WV_118_8]